MSSPYQDETYAGTYAQTNQAEVAALVTGITSGATTNVGGYSYEIAQLNGSTENYVATQEARARADHLGTHSGPSSAGTIYTSIPHEELYRATHTNIDSSGIFENGRSWNSVGNSYTDNANDLLKMVGASREGWTGPAADDFHASMTTLANHIGQVGEAAQSSGAQLYVQSEAADTVRNAVPQPTGFDKNAALTAMFTGNPKIFTQQFAAQAKAADEAHAQAAEATQTYEQTMTQAVATSPKFAPPPAGSSSGAKGGLGTGPAATAGAAGGAHRFATGSTSPVSVTRAGSPGSTAGAGPSGGGATGGTGGTGPTTTSDYTGTPATGNPETGLPNTGNPAVPSNPGGAGPVMDVTALPVGGNPGGFGGDQLRGGRAYGGGVAGSGSGENVRNMLGGNGSGARSGIGGEAASEAALRSGIAAEAEGRPGIAGLPGAGGRKKDEDKEHQSPGYLESNELNQVITGDLGHTIRPVLGGEK